jgi:hypothetical protein
MDEDVSLSQQDLSSLLASKRLAGFKLMCFGIYPDLAFLQCDHMHCALYV